jgi:RimJ/RimL family protein N-acetyltransferase/catechol 2,3-dioxygenase-like lactoylglutathione lyase family enzyme
MTLPRLITARLTLRPFTLADAAAVTRLAGDAAIARTTATIPQPYPEGAAVQWIASHAEAWHDGTGMELAVVERATDELVGAIGLGIAARHRRAELGYWIGRPYWGRGYCTEAAIAILAFGFDDLGLNKVTSRHMTTNPASGRVMQKAGMRYEGRLRQELMKDGELVDLVVYGKLREERSLPLSGPTDIAFLVREYVEAIAFFTQKLGFDLIEDTDLGEGKRWVLVAAPGEGSPRLVLSRAANEQQASAVGKQAGGRVFLFLETDDFERDHTALIACGVRFVREPRREAYGTVAVFADLYGNHWDLIQRRVIRNT